MKLCTKCKKELPATAEYYFKEPKGKHGLRSKCKQCLNEARKECRAKNREMHLANQRRYYHKTSEKRREEMRKYYWSNPEKSCERVRNWNANNPERARENNKKWVKDNPDKARANWNRQDEKRRENPTWVLSNRISRAIGKSIKSGKNGHYWESLVGYTREEIMLHLEEKFQTGMSWNNHGSWHIDHIRAISSFNFSSPDEDEFKECWSLKNLQPLWAQDNLKKGG